MCAIARFLFCEMKKVIKVVCVFLGLLFLVAILNPFLIMAPLLAAGLYEGSQGGRPFEDSHERAVDTFVKSAGFGRARFRKAGLWNDMTVLYQGELYVPIKIRLVGVTPEFGRRLFIEDFPPTKKQIPESVFQELSTNEDEAVERLMNKETLYEEIPFELESEFDFKRVVAPIIASEDCLRCHAVEVGEMLGAFDYVLRSMRRVEETSAVLQADELNESVD